MDLRVLFIFLAVTLCVQAQGLRTTVKDLRRFYFTQKGFHCHGQMGAICSLFEDGPWHWGWQFRSLTMNPDKDDYYTAIVVEYSPLLPGNEKTNLENYEFFIQTAAIEQANIIVFPEGGLTQIPYYVPDPLDHISPCLQKPPEDVIGHLSCFAKENKIYVVVNLPEKREIDGCCGQKKTVRYNTNVVFDRNGTVVARYPKYNLFDEPFTNKPEKLEVSYFDTDFGVRFGTFICFDILFSEPALTLVKKLNITDIIFTTRWFSELPFLTALQVQRAWSEVNNVTLLASGYNNPGQGSTGSGIFDGKMGPIVHYMGNEKASRLLVAKIPKRTRNYVPPRPINTRVMNKGPEDVKEDFVLLSDHLEVYKTVVVPVGWDVDMKLCQNDFCCEFSLLLLETGKNPNNYSYRAVAFDGVRRFGLMHTGGVQVCAIVFCAGPELTHCTQRAFDLKGIHRFTRIRIEGKFSSENAMQIPTTLIEEDDLNTFPPGSYAFSTEEIPKENRRMVTLSTNVPTDSLMTFGIWGRDFSRDGQKPSNASWKSAVLSLLMTALAFVGALV